MNVLVILIPVSLILGGIGLAAFLWTIRSEQYDDAKGNAARILLEDEDQVVGPSPTESADPIAKKREAK
jgi:cbb3-type cytochrome oxidase maturation protein